MKFVVEEVALEQVSLSSANHHPIIAAYSPAVTKQFIIVSSVPSYPNTETVMIDSGTVS
jgi:hypothetical protein